jgi:endonuclease-3
MTRQERARLIERRLDELYPDVEPPLSHADPFTLLVAVVLSAQCTDKRVNEVSPRLFALADSPEKMAKRSAGEIEKIIRPCGLGAAKAKNIRELSRLLIERHGGKVPRTFEELEALPGVGHKTASVVMWSAFGHPSFPVDTHIHRLATRWKLSRGKNVVETERDLKRLFPQDEWGRRHLQIIFYGREHCPARGCDRAPCLICRMLSRGGRRRTSVAARRAGA